MTDISAAEARSLAIRAQRLAGRRHRDPSRLLAELGAIQLDTISVVARSHELVCHARLATTTRADIDRAFFSGRGEVIEYWAHAACLLPVSMWPWMAWRRRRYGERWLKGSADGLSARREVLARLSDGPLTAADLGGARRAPGWWEWSPLKRAAEELLAAGEVVCSRRAGWRRVYDFPERVLAPELRRADPTDAECARVLVRLALERLGVGTVDDIADYYRLPLTLVRTALRDADVREVGVEGWGRPAYMLHDGARNSGTIAHRPVLLSPFDSLIWHRPRTERLFKVRYRIATYTPAHLREHGYFVMPLLARGRIGGRADPKRDGDALRVRHLDVVPGGARAMAEALTSLATAVGCNRVVIDDAVESGIAADVREHLRNH